MKYFIIALVLSMSFISCEDVESHDFVMQAKIGEKFYTSTDANATIAENGNVIIEGSTWDEKLILRVDKLKKGDFNLGAGVRNSAKFESVNGNVYTTNSNATGVVTISEVNELHQTFSGTFHFSAVVPELDTIYVSKGFLFNIPYNSGIEYP